MSKKTSTWLRAAGVRAVKTVAQTALIASVDWRVVVSASLLAGVLSVLTSVAGLPEVKQ